MADTLPLQLAQVQLKNFRCFAQYSLDFTNQVVLIEGNNGTGKTALLEALHYSCYLRSFRAHSPKDLIQFGYEGFFVKVRLKEQEFFHDIQVGFSGSRRLVKVNQKAISSYKELMNHYRVVSLTEDDLILIKGSPQVRRNFIDQALLLYDPDYAILIREFRQVVNNRNVLLARGSAHRETYMILTEQLWHKSCTIQQARIQLLDFFGQEITALAKQYFDKSVVITFDYRPKGPQADSLAVFMQASSTLYQNELQAGRSLFGAHLDDFIIRFQDKKSKQFASRGQQKLVVLLMKIAQIKQLSRKKGPAIFLLDDFMTDFDPERVRTLFSILAQLDTQLIFTCPVGGSILSQQLQSMGGQVIKLTH